MLTLRSMFLRCSRICMVCLVLELLGSWEVVGFGVGMEAFGWSVIELIYFKNAIEVLVDTLVYDALQLCNSLILVHDISCYWLTSSYLSFRKT